MLIFVNIQLLALGVELLGPYDLCDLHLHRRLTELVSVMWRLNRKDGSNGDGWMILVSLKDATSGLGRNKTNKPTPLSLPTLPFLPPSSLYHHFDCAS